MSNFPGPRTQGEFSGHVISSTSNQTPRTQSRANQSSRRAPNQTRSHQNRAYSQNRNNSASHRVSSVPAESRNRVESSSRGRRNGGGRQYGNGRGLNRNAGVPDVGFERLGMPPFNTPPPQMWNNLGQNTLGAAANTMCQVPRSRSVPPNRNSVRGRRPGVWKEVTMPFPYVEQEETHSHGINATSGAATSRFDDRHSTDGGNTPSNEHLERQNNSSASYSLTNSSVSYTTNSSASYSTNSTKIGYNTHMNNSQQPQFVIAKSAHFNKKVKSNKNWLKQIKTIPKDFSVPQSVIVQNVTKAQSNTSDSSNHPTGTAMASSLPSPVHSPSESVSASAIRLEQSPETLSLSPISTPSSSPLNADPPSSRIASSQNLPRKDTVTPNDNSSDVIQPTTQAGQNKNACFSSETATQNNTGFLSADSNNNEADRPNQNVSQTLQQSNQEKALDSYKNGDKPVQEHETDRNTGLIDDETSSQRSEFQSQIYEEMRRAQEMSIPVILDPSKTKSGSLNPYAQCFDPKVTHRRDSRYAVANDGYGCASFVDQSESTSRDELKSSTKCESSDSDPMDHGYPHPITVVTTHRESPMAYDSYQPAPGALDNGCGFSLDPNSPMVHQPYPDNYSINSYDHQFPQSQHQPSSHHAQFYNASPYDPSTRDPNNLYYTNPQQTPLQGNPMLIQDNSSSLQVATHEDAGFTRNVNYVPGLIPATEFSHHDSRFDLLTQQTCIQHHYLPPIVAQKYPSLRQLYVPLTPPSDINSPSSTSSPCYFTFNTAPSPGISNATYSFTPTPSQQPIPNCTPNAPRPNHMESPNSVFNPNSMHPFISAAPVPSPNAPFLNSAHNASYVRANDPLMLYNPSGPIQPLPMTSGPNPPILNMMESLKHFDTHYHFDTHSHFDSQNSTLAPITQRYVDLERASPSVPANDGDV